MKGKNWILITLIPIALIIGVAIGRMTHPVDSAIRKARRMAPRSDEAKIEALELLDKADQFIELALKNGALQEQRHFISVALGEHLIEREMWLEAKEHLEYSKDILPGDYSVNYNLGVVYASLYNLEQDIAEKLNYLDNARDCLEVALIAEPNDPNANYVLGILNYKQGLTEKALANFERVLEQFPKDIPCLMAKARIYYDQGYYEEAKKLYLKLENLVPADDSRFDTIQENLKILNEALIEEGGIME